MWWRGAYVLNGLRSEFNLISNCWIYFRLKLECEKLAGEKTEMQRHYVMVSERVFRVVWWREVCRVHLFGDFYYDIDLRVTISQWSANSLRVCVCVLVSGNGLGWVDGLWMDRWLAGTKVILCVIFG